MPIYNIDKRPFALLCAYSTGERTTPFVSALRALDLDPSRIDRRTIALYSLRDTNFRIYAQLVSVAFSLCYASASLYYCVLGVIILSAVLKRRMILADKAKSLFISK